MSRTIVVVRGDCDIGSAVACNLARNGVKVKAVVVDDSKSQILQSCNVEVIQCNLKTEKNKLKDVLTGVDGCFVVTKSDFCDSEFVEKEIEEGQIIADVCESAKVPHVVFSSQLHPFKTIAVSARHLIAKAEIDEYIRHMQLQLPVTFILIPPLYEEYFTTLKPIKSSQGHYEIVIPMGTTPFNMIAADDVGNIVSVIFGDKKKYLNKTVSVCGDKRRVKEMSDCLSLYLAPVQFHQRQLTTYQFSQMGQPWSQDYANMFDFILRVDQRYNLEETRKMHKKTQTFQDWVSQNIEKLKAAFP